MPRGKSRHRRLSEAEQDLWARAIQDAAPLPGKTRPAVQPPPVEPVIQAASLPPASSQSVNGQSTLPASLPAPIRLASSRLATGTAGLDRRTAEKLQRGHLPIEARLDLHGLTQDEARVELDKFIARAWSQGRRTLLIITGKGSRDDSRGDREGDSWTRGRGVLRANVPRWLHEAPNGARILALADAQPRHGGTGALYVLIRRQRGE